MILLYFCLTFFACWTFFRRSLEPIENWFLKVATIFFLGTFLSVMIIFIFCLIYSLFTHNLLLKSTYTYLILLAVYLAYSYRNFIVLFNGLVKKLAKMSHLKLFGIATIFVFFYTFFSNHFTISGNQLFSSFTYWDLHWHIQLIENFAHGDNFPPQNESVAGIYNIYHYFWAIIPAIYQTLGLNLAQALNLYSTLFLSMIVITALGLMQLYGYTKIAYIVLPLYVLTHGSFKFLDYFRYNLVGLYFAHIPYYIDINSNTAFGYNGNMFSIFYFIQERQLIFACFALLIFVMFILNIEKFKTNFILFMGLVFGLFIQWHLYVSIIIFVVSIGYTVTSMFIYKKYLFKLVIFTLLLSTVFLATLLILKIYILFDPQFDHAYLNQFPFLNFGFSTMKQYGFSLTHALQYYLYAYGFRILMYVFSIWYSYKHQKKIFILLVSFLPVFILINTVQLSPESIYDNHKWLKPFNLIFDTFSIIFFLKALSHRIWGYTVIIPIVVITTMSGFIALMLFFFQSPDIPYANYSSLEYKSIELTNPRSVFLTNDPRLVFLTGRKTYIAEYPGGNLGIQTENRWKVLNDVENFKNQKAMCEYIIKNKLSKEFDYVYFKDRNIFFRTSSCPIK